MHQETRAIIISSDKYNDKKDGQPKQVLTLLSENDKTIGVLKYWLEPHEVRDESLNTLKSTDIVLLKIEQVEKGFNSYSKIVSIVREKGVNASLLYLDENGEPVE